MPLDSLTHQWRNLLESVKTSRRETPPEGQSPFIHQERDEPPTLTELVRQAA